MTLIDLAKSIRAAWDELFKREPKPEPTNPLVTFVDHLKEEIAQLQNDKTRLDAKCEMLQLKLEIALTPKVAVAVVQAPRTLPKVSAPPTTSWEAYRDNYIREQEAEEQRELAAQAT